MYHHTGYHRADKIRALAGEAACAQIGFVHEFADAVPVGNVSVVAQRVGHGYYRNAQVFRDAEAGSRPST